VRDVQLSCATCRRPSFGAVVAHSGYPSPLVYHHTTGNAGALRWRTHNDSELGMSDIINRNAVLLRVVEANGLLEWLEENNSPANLRYIYDHPCTHCSYPKTGLGGLRQSDGRIAVKVYCARCHRAISGSLRVPDALRDRISIIREKKHHPCQVDGCSDIFSQTHHVFPHSIDWELSWKYPTIYLCEYHHRLWHQKTGIATGGKTR
jgi:hypothetical protein